MCLSGVERSLVSKFIFLGSVILLQDGENDPPNADKP